MYRVYSVPWGWAWLPPGRAPSALLTGTAGGGLGACRLLGGGAGGPGLPDALPVGVSPPTQAARLNSRAPAQNTGTSFFIVSSFSTMALGLSLRSGVIGAIIATSASAVKEFSPTFTLWSRNLYRPVKKARSLTGGIFYQMDEFGKRGKAVPVLLLWRGRTGALFCQAGAGGIS